MEKILLGVKSLTLALKGKEILNKNGFYSKVVRTTGAYDGNGCGYSIYITKGDIDLALDLLESNGIKVIKRSGGKR